jgi:hypothetical protein
MRDLRAFAVVSGGVMRTKLQSGAPGGGVGGATTVTERVTVMGLTPAKADPLLLSNTNSNWRVWAPAVLKVSEMRLFASSV